MYVYVREDRVKESRGLRGADCDRRCPPFETLGLSPIGWT